MTIQIQYFQVNKLFGLHENIRVSFDENRMILVGKNGSGKSTIVKLFYYLVSMDWYRLMSTNFGSLDLMFYDVNGNDLRVFIELDWLDAIVNNVDNYLLDEARRDNNHARFNNTLNRIIDRVGFGSQVSIFADNDRFLTALSQVRQAKNILAKMVDFRIIYLPTYRRIEESFGNMFPKLSNLNLKGYYDRKLKHNELIGFGMDDVEEILANEMERLSFSFTENLNRLMGEYLKGIIRNSHMESTFSNLSKDSIKTKIIHILGRIDDTALPIAEKNIIIDMILNSKKEKIEGREAILYFISRLIDFHDSQSEVEASLIEFVHLCNKYLVENGKQLIFDRVNFKVKIWRIKTHESAIDIDGEFNFIVDESGNILYTEKLVDLALSDLSSGEKQLIAIFTYLCIGENRTDLFVLIDEPELSSGTAAQST